MCINHRSVFHGSVRFEIQPFLHNTRILRISPILMIFFHFWNIWRDLSVYCNVLHLKLLKNWSGMQPLAIVSPKWAGYHILWSALQHSWFWYIESANRLHQLQISKILQSFKRVNSLRVEQSYIIVIKWKTASACESHPGGRGRWGYGCWPAGRGGGHSLWYRAG